MEIKREDNYESDSYAMLASNTFDFILEQIKKSSLNFQIQLSPFSAYISLKKSLVTDKSGVPQLPRLASGARCYSDRTDLPKVFEGQVENYGCEDVPVKNCVDDLTCKTESSQEYSGLTADERKKMKKERQKQCKPE